MDVESVKCLKCRKVKNRAEYFAHEKSGALYTTCIICVEEARSIQRDKRRRKFENGHKCPGCKVTKPATEYRVIDAKDWKFSTRCSECMNITEKKKREASLYYWRFISQGRAKALPHNYPTPDPYFKKWEWPGKQYQRTCQNLSVSQM